MLPKIIPDASGCKLTTTGNANGASCTFTIDATDIKTSADNYTITTLVTMPDGSQQQAKQTISVNLMAQTNGLHISTTNVNVPVLAVSSPISINLTADNNSLGKNVNLSFRVLGTKDDANPPKIVPDSSNCQLVTGSKPSCTIKIDATDPTTNIDDYTITTYATLPDGSVKAATQQITANVTGPTIPYGGDTITLTDNALSIYVGGVTSTSISVQGSYPGSVGVGFKVTGGAQGTQPKVTTTPGKCILSAGNPSQSSCGIVVDATNAAAGTYQITPTVAFPSKQTKTMTPITVTVTTLPVVPTAGTVGFDNINQGMMAWDTNRIVTLSLTGNTDGNPAKFNLSSTNPQAATVTPTTCTLSITANSCTVTITGVAANTATILAQADNSNADPYVVAPVQVHVNDLFAGNNLSNVFNKSGLLLTGYIATLYPENPTANVISSATDKSNNLYVGYDDGTVFENKAGTNNWINLTQQYNAPNNGHLCSVGEVGVGSYCYINAIVITSDGTVYVSGGRQKNFASYEEAQVFAFKNNTWTTLPLITTTGYTAVTSLALDISNNLYITTFDGEGSNSHVLKYDSIAGSYTDLLATYANQANLAVMTIYIDKSNNIYIGDGNLGDVLELPTSQTQWTLLPEKTPGGGVDGSNGFIVGLVEDNSGNVFADVGFTNYSGNNGSNGGLYELKSGGSQWIVVKDGIGNGKYDYTSNIAIDSNNNLYVARHDNTNNKISILQFKDSNGNLTQVGGENNSIIQTVSLASLGATIVTDSANNLYETVAHSVYKGLSATSMPPSLGVQVPNYSLDGSVISNFVDSNNQLWAGTTNLFMNSSPFAGGSFAQDAGYTTDGNYVYSIAEDSSGNMYAGSGIGIVYKLAKESTTWQAAGIASGPVKNGKPSLDGSAVFQITTDKNNNVYAATASGNLWKLPAASGAWIQLQGTGAKGTIDGHADYNVVYDAVNDILYTATSNSGYVYEINDPEDNATGATAEWTKIKNNSTYVCPGRVYQLGVDQSGNVYAGCNNGQVMRLSYPYTAATAQWIPIGAAVDSSGIGYYAQMVVDPISEHVYITSTGNATVGYGNVYDCYGPAATCTAIPNFGGSTINHATSGSTIQSLSMTHF